MAVLGTESGTALRINGRLIQAVPLGITPLPAPTMTLAVPAGLTNAAYGQIVGTPTVAGLTGTLAWSMTQQNLCTAPGTTLKPRYAIDAATGQITAPGLLSAPMGGARSDPLAVACTDGTRSVTATFQIPVSAAVGPVYHVGTARPASAGANGFDHFLAVKEKFSIDDLNRPAASDLGATIMLYRGADPEEFANDGGGPADPRTQDQTLRDALRGPFAIVGVPDAAGNLPRLGGRTGSVGEGYDYGNKGCLDLGDGDFTLKNLEISHVHATVDLVAGPPGHQMSGIRLNGNRYGDCVIDNCNIHDCDNGIESGTGTGDLTITRTRLASGGTGRDGGAYTHNIYCGQLNRLSMTDCLTFNSTGGHGIKSRAEQTILTRVRSMDGVLGDASAQVDLPDGGYVRIKDCVFQKGPNCQAAQLVRFAFEGGNCRAHDYAVETSVFLSLSPDTSSNGAIQAVAQTGFIDAAGAYSILALAGNSYFGFAPASRVSYYKFNANSAKPADGHDYTPAETGAALLAAPPALDFSSPGTFPVQRPGPVSWVDANSPEPYPNFAAGQFACDRDDIRISASAAASTTVATFAATGLPLWASSSSTQPDIRIQPFVAGTTYALMRDAGPFGGVPWAPAGRYAIDSNGTLTVAGALVAGVDYVLMRATAPNGTIVDRRASVVVTA